MKEIHDFKLYPKSKERVIIEVKRAFDEYDNDKLSDADFINLMHHYKEYTNDQKFLGEFKTEYNGGSLQNQFYVSKSTQNRIGKNRSQTLRENS